MRRSSFMEDPDYEPSEDIDDEVSPPPPPPPPPSPPSLLGWAAVKKRTSTATTQNYGQPLELPSTNQAEEILEIPPRNTILSSIQVPQTSDGARRFYDQIDHRTVTAAPIFNIENVAITSHPINPNLEVILQSIINKHGDISKDCHFKSNYVIATMLESICMIIEDLQGKKLEGLDVGTLLEYDVFLKDAEKMNFNVKWLRLQVVQLLDAVKSFVAANEATLEKTELEKKIEDIEKDIQGGRADIESLNSFVQERERELALRKHEGDNLSVTIAGLKNRYQYLLGQPLTIDGLL